MYRSAERPAIQSAYTGAFGGLLWYSQGAGGVDISPLKARRLQKLSATRLLD